MKFRQPISEERAKIKQRKEQGLASKSDAEIAQWVHANVRNLADARSLLIEIVQQQRDILQYLAKPPG